jgi:hypothetical protein
VHSGALPWGVLPWAPIIPDTSEPGYSLLGRPLRGHLPVQDLDVRSGHLRHPGPFAEQGLETDSALLPQLDPSEAELQAAARSRQQ